MAFDSLEILSSRSKLNERVVRKLFDNPLEARTVNKHVYTVICLVVFDDLVVDYTSEQ